MELEIDRRCTDCGAAVRARSAFCPQCGRAMITDGAATPAPEQKSAGPEPEVVRDEKKDVSSSNRQLNVTAPSVKAGDLPSPAAPKAEPISHPAQVAREQIVSGKAIEPLPEPRARGKGQRVVGAARDVVEERIGPRVEKLKQASNVVWGEAQDDPNLRFILVAVFLFILALVIILLGTYLR